MKEQLKPRSPIIFILAGNLDVKKVLILQHIACEGPGSLGFFLESKGVSFEYRQLANGDTVPVSLKDYSALICLGGPMNVDEEGKYPFLKDEKRLLKEALQKDFPTLGICLGAQLIARAANALVTAGPQKEIGWFPLKLTREGLKDSLLEGLPQELKIFQWHGDTFEIPLGALHLASSDLFHHQAFKIGEKIYALQFHIEVTSEMIQDWVRTYREEKIDVEKILKETNIYISNLEKTAEHIYSHLWEVWKIA